MASRTARVVARLAVAIAVGVVAMMAAQVPMAAGMTMVLGGSSEQCFFEDLEVNTKLQGSFEVVAGGTLLINCKVFGPGGSVHYAIHQERDGSFLLLAPRTGTFRICFDNKDDASDKTLDFVIHDASSPFTSQLAQKEHLSPLEEGINELSVGIVQLQDEQRYMRARERAHRDTTESTNSRVLWFTFLEATVLVGMSLWQVWTLRTFFETRSDV